MDHWEPCVNNTLTCPFWAVCVQPIRYVTPELAQCHVPLANLALALLIYSAIVLVIGICLGQHIKCQRRREPGGEPPGPIIGGLVREMSARFRRQLGEIHFGGASVRVPPVGDPTRRQEDAPPGPSNAAGPAGT